MNHKTADLVRAAATGDRAAFEELVSQHAAMVAGVAYSKCGDFTLSEDIAQEAFIEAWKKLATIQEPEKFPGWICTIVRRRAADAARKSKTSLANFSLNEMVSEVQDPKQLTPETRMSAQQERELVWSMLARLPEAYREPMVLFYRCEESTRSVATALGETEATVRQRLKRGRDLMRTELAGAMRNTLGTTAPQAAFSAMVIAALPSTTQAAGAAATTATAATTSKVGGAAGTAATTALGGAVLGTLVGIAGGVFGTWMSWKNSEYESQQKFILRQSLQFVTGLAVAGTLFLLLIVARKQEVIASNAVFGWWMAGLVIVSQGFNLAWILRCIHGYKRVGKEAELRGEPMRESVRQQWADAEEQTRVLQEDGSVSYEAFRWNASGWFGSCIGSVAWMLPTGAIGFANGDISMAILSWLCFLFAMVLMVVVWQKRERIDAYWACQCLLVVLASLTITVFSGMQFLSNPKTQALLQWSPWAWCMLFLFPVMSLVFWWKRHSFAQIMQPSRL